MSKTCIQFHYWLFPKCIGRFSRRFGIKEETQMTYIKPFGTKPTLNLWYIWRLNYNNRKFKKNFGEMKFLFFKCAVATSMKIWLKPVLFVYDTAIRIHSMLEFQTMFSMFQFKVHILWEGYKILQNLHLTFD